MHLVFWTMSEMIPTVSSAFARTASRVFSLNSSQSTSVGGSARMSPCRSSSDAAIVVFFSTFRRQRPMKSLITAKEITAVVLMLFEGG